MPETQPPAGPLSVQSSTFKFQLPHATEARFCNAFRIDKEAFPGHHLVIFALVISGRFIGSISFTFENGMLLGRKQSMLQYLQGLRAAKGIPEFTNPTIDIPINLDGPRPVDHIVLTQNGHTTEFAFYTWSWAITNSPLPERPNLIFAHLYPILRCTASLQIAWIEEIYGDDARIQPRPIINFDATPKQL
jgi:hypothetical protein